MTVPPTTRTTTPSPLTPQSHRQRSHAPLTYIHAAVPTTTPLTTLHTTNGSIFSVKNVRNPFTHSRKYYFSEVSNVLIFYYGDCKQVLKVLINEELFLFTCCCFSVLIPSIISADYEKWTKSDRFPPSPTPKKINRSLSLLKVLYIAS